MMNYKILLLFTFLLYGCTSPNTGIESSPNPTSIPTETVNVHATDVVKSTQIVENKSIRVKEICPTKRSIFGKYPSLLTSAKLITVLEDKIGFLDIKTGNIETYHQPISIANTLFFSPDGKHIAYLSKEMDRSDLWVLTPSEGEDVKSFEISTDTVWLQWISNTKIALWNYANPAGCQQYGGFFDIDTEKVTRLTRNLSELGMNQCRLLPSISEDGLRALYPWQMQDLNTGNIQRIYLPKDITTDPPLYALDWSADEISILSFDENHVSYRLNLQVDRLTNQQIHFQTIQMPVFATKSYYWKRPVFKSNLGHFGWDLIDPKIDVSKYFDPAQGNLPTVFHTINLNSNEMVNYCLDRSVPHEISQLEFAKPVNSGYFSPDGKYLSWTIYSTADYTPPIETQVLELETGKVIVFPNIEIFGWVVP